MIKFTKLQRITQRSEYQSLSKTAKKFKSPYWIILNQRNQLDSARIGITVSKKCAKLAVDRNRIKRLIRESFRHYYQLLPNIDIVIIARWPVKNLSNEELRNDLDKQWEKLKKLYE